MVNLVRRNKMIDPSLTQIMSQFLAFFSLIWCFATSNKEKISPKRLIIKYSADKIKKFVETAIIKTTFEV